uniref:Uncharacterized protein n=1 Tax=Clastoptera arizonana TaxID=38151 RepID=A0A1B6EBC8_9HEMI
MYLAYLVCFLLHAHTISSFKGKINEFEPDVPEYSKKEIYKLNKKAADVEGARIIAHRMIKKGNVTLENKYEEIKKVILKEREVFVDILELFKLRGYTNQRLYDRVAYAIERIDRLKQHENDKIILKIHYLKKAFRKVILARDDLFIDGILKYKETDEALVDSRELVSQHVISGDYSEFYGSFEKRFG